MFGHPNQGIDAQVARQSVEGRALYYFTACAGQKSLGSSLEMVKYDVAHYGFEDGVAQKFQSFVVVGASLLVSVDVGFVCEGNTIDFELMRIEAENGVELLTKNFILLKRQSQAVNKVRKHAIS